MTNYMELLMTSQPWNLIAFMVLPVAMAELITMAEFFILSDAERHSGWKKLSHYLGMVLGVYFAGVVLYLTFMVVPQIEFRGWIDKMAVGAYMLGGVPLVLIALQEAGIISRNCNEKRRMGRHIVLLVMFLIVSHVAMVFGMVDPALGGWQPAPQYDMMNHDSGAMPSMDDSHMVPHHMKH